MPLASGTRLGPYEIETSIGAGGMGEVYRARDKRLGREVAVKVLPAVFGGDRDRLRRFEQEARAASLLNHPNIVTIFDVGTDGGVSYLVSEFLDGQTLRERLDASPLPPRKAVECATQVAQAIAAAHEKGIVHRDLKPDNIFLTRDGRVKVLDFGLAKLREGQPSVAVGDLTTLAPGTQAGVVLGTVGYMAPEQVRGLDADARSDIFALGTILYEMVTGRRAFHRDSAAETMAAIVREDPPPLEQSGVAVPPAVARIIDHCLEKNPDERFQSARDLAFDLRALSDVSASRPAGAPAIGSARRGLLSRLAPLGIAVLALAAIGAVSFVAGRRFASAPLPSFQKITFRQGDITGARFAPDGETVIYSASWGGAPEQLFLAQPGNPESRAFDLPAARLLSVSKKGELAVMLDPQFQGGFNYSGTLARVPATGGAARELMEDVEEADWGPDGESLAVVRLVGGKDRLEYPIGNVLFETAGYLSAPRISPGGDRVAFLHHPVRGDDAGDVVLADRQKKIVTLSKGWLSVVGLTWAGNEVMFTASPTGFTKPLYAVAPGGEARLVANGTGSLLVFDRAQDGRTLLARSSDRLGMAGRGPADQQERDLSWLDWSLVREISRDGKTVVFDETGEGGGPSHAVYLRSLDGSPAVRLGDGVAPALSADGKWVACLRGDPPEITLLATGAGESRRIPTGKVRVSRIEWFPDGRRLIIGGYEPGRAYRFYVLSLAGGDPRPITPEGATGYSRALSPDGRYLLSLGSDGTTALYSVDGRGSVPVRGLTTADVAIGMPTADSVYVHNRRGLPLSVARVDLQTGRRTTALEVGGRSQELTLPFTIRVSSDARTYVYSYIQRTSELFLMQRGQ